MARLGKGEAFLLASWVLLPLLQLTYAQLRFVEVAVNPHAVIPEDSPVGYVVNYINDTSTDPALAVVSVEFIGSDQQFYTEQLPGEQKWEVLLNTTLDYDRGARSFNVRFRANGGNGIDSTDVTFAVHVTDVNDNSPQFGIPAYNVDVNEDESPGSVVFTGISATDVDDGLGKVISFSLQPVIQGIGGSGQEDKFVIDRESGNLTLNGPLDYESRTFFHYLVIAKDGGTPSLNSSADLFVTVKDVQDSPPVFTNLPYISSVDENTALGRAVLTVKAVDQDRAIPNQVGYNITHSNCPGLFALDATSGIISVHSQLDRETSPLKNNDGRCTITLQATEQSGIYPQKGNFTATETATITVNDVNDNAPAFSKTSFSANITENSPVGTPLQLGNGQQIVATDIDQGSNSEITLSLLGADDTFELVTPHLQGSGTVQLRVKNSSRLDFERHATLIVKIKAVDANSSHTHTATVTVHVENVNEVSPEFGSTEYTAAVEEGSSPGTAVVNVTATDTDAGEFGAVTYSLRNDRGLFQINQSTGIVTVASNQTDREREDRYYMMVVATDGGGLQQTVPLTVNITDRNDNAPVFQRDQYDSILNENSTNLRRLVQVEASDADEPDTPNSNVTFSIRETTPINLQGHFRLDPKSGQLSVVTALDYEAIQFPSATQGVITIVVIASDHGTPTKKTSTATIAVTLIDLNDETPAFPNRPYSKQIAENSSPGTSVLTVNATDADGSAPNNVITYSIERGGQDRFRISPDNGTITVSGKLDREQVSNYTLVVVARDRAASPKSSSSSVRITISDVNDEPPSFGNNADVRIERNESFHGVLYDMTAKDPDMNSALRYEILYDQSSGQSGSFQSLTSSTIRSLVNISATTGQVTTKRPLNRGAVQQMTLAVRVKDANGISTQVDTATLTITVIDINDHGPEFSPPRSAIASIRENMRQGTALTFATPLRIADLDEGANSRFNVNVTGNYSGFFEVSPSSVQSSADLVVTVTNGSLLDYEAHRTLEITLVAQESQTVEKRSSSVVITVNIEDENDNSPNFTQPSYEVSLPENSHSGTSVAVVNATDKDGSTEFNNVTYSLQGADGLFHIHPTTGVVTQLTGDLDYDTQPNTYQLTVLASDNGGQRASAPLVVKLTDLNDLAPVFDHTVFTAILKEGETSFESPAIVHAVDGDKPRSPNSNVTYSIISSRPSAYKTNFTIDAYTGAITVDSPVDFESHDLSSHTINLTVQAADGGTPRRIGASRVQITVVDVNDFTPTFTPAVYTQRVLENATTGTRVYTFNAADGDGSPPNNDVYYLISSGANDQFVVNSTTGVLTVSRLLDREAVQSYSLVILATDRGVPPKTGTATLSVILDDVNDVAPVFAQSSITVDVEENRQGVLYTMNATDVDENAELNYRINWTHSSAQDPLQKDIPNLQSLFRVDEDTGAISVNGTLDRETVQSAILKIEVQDLKAATGVQTATGTLTINVKDADDNPPEFSEYSVTASVDENSAEGVPINMGQLGVTDRDQGDNSEFSLRVTPAYNRTVRVVPTTARGSTVLVLRVGDNSLLDFERRTHINFQIIAEDTKNRTMNKYCNVTLNINNVNDNLPRFTKDTYEASVNESAHLGTQVTSVSATDGDKGTLGNITYSILGNTQLFHIDPNSGRITTASNQSNYDRETTPEYFLTVMAKDGGNATTTARVHVTVNDVNDEAPVFLRPEYSAFVNENSDKFKVGVQVQAKDADGPGRNSEVRYSIPSSSPWSGNFSVNGTTGVLRLISPLDYEALRPDSEGVITLVVLATDRGSPQLTGSVNVAVTVQDTNDRKPAFTRPGFSGRVRENEPEGTYVASVNATDNDGSAPNNDVFYLIASGGNDQFRINSTSGAITTVSQLDREESPSYSLTVLAVDRGSPSKTASVIVSVDVINVNDDAPKFPSDDVTVTPTEELPPGSLVYNFSAHDGDEDALLNYRILWNRSTGYKDDQTALTTGKLQDAFTIDNTTGVVTVNKRLDRETLDTATLSIFVTDLHAETQGQNATGTLTIRVQDIDDNPPIFSATSFNASVDENSPEGTPLQLNLQLSLNDEDKDANSRFNLTLTGYTDCLRVLPTAARGQASVVMQVINQSCFDFEKIQTMDFDVLATPYVNASNAQRAHVNLSIKNLNDERPKFHSPAYSKNVTENAAAGKSITTVLATDNDRDPFNIITYSLQGGDGRFVINNQTGVVTVGTSSQTAGLDYETRKQYVLVVDATDAGGLRDSVTLTINLQDVNDNRPEFRRPEYQAFVKENDSDFGTEVKVEATDKDDGVNKEIRYSISPSSELADNFTMNATTGSLQLRDSAGLDYESLPNTATGVVHLVIRACDRGNPALCSNVSLLVTVEDRNDNAPVFSHNYHHNISEDAPVGASLVTVLATDADGKPPNNNVFYVMAGGGNDKFKVDSSSGLISRAGELDSDTQNSYNLTISAIDGGSPALTATANVTVYVMDVNDVIPTFNPEARIIRVNESDGTKRSDSGRTLTSLWATDSDVDSALLYDVVWDESQGFGPNQEPLDAAQLQEAFKVQKRGGQIQVNSTLDRERISRAILVVNVTDTNAANVLIQTGTGTLTINVLDVNDHHPSFNNRAYVAEIQETSVKDSVLKLVSTDQINVTDADTDQNCVFNISVVGDNSAYFKAEPATARSFALVQLRVVDSSILDYEMRTSINITLQATETDTVEHFRSTVRVTVNIIDVNDNDPKFDFISYNATVAENSQRNTRIKRIHATDQDSGSFGNITFSLEGDADRFRIDSVTGELSTADNSTDRETKDLYLMTVVATDGGGRRSGVPLKVTIEDINDERPRFLSNYSTRVLENSRIPSPPVVVEARDDDQVNTANSNVTYHLENCAHCSSFSLHPISGQLTILSEFDFEQIQNVLLTVEARDQGNPRLTGTATVTVEIQDVNDVDPMFSQSVYHAHVSENSDEGTHVTGVSASDGDGSRPNNITFYVLDSGRGSDKFRINSTTGFITVGPGANLDRERDEGGFSLTVLASDRGDPPRSSSATVSVSLLDVNDELPVFPEVRTEVKIYENASINSEVALLHAYDNDSDSDLIYTLLLDQSLAATDRDVSVNVTFIKDWFKIAPDTGRVNVGSKLDREVAEVIVLKVLVNDTKGVKHLPQTALATLTVTLLDVNDNAPEIRGANSLRVSESLAEGTEVASLTARDADRDQTVTFTILRATEPYFNVSSDGKVFLLHQIDRETTPRANFTVIATDSGWPPLSSNVTISVTILDANDNDPRFLNASYVFHVDEDASNETLVAIVEATDDDIGPNANVTFDFADNVLDFVINRTGAITVKRPLNREERPSYTFGVAALDNPITDVKRRAIQQVIVIVNDVNDNPPRFTNIDPLQQAYAAQIDETKEVGEKVLNMKPGPVRASDEDVGQNANLSFYLSTRDAEDSSYFFSMDERTGEVFVNSSIMGKADTYNFTVTVMDHGQPSLNASGNLTIEVKDRNINKPYFVGNYSDLHVAECAKIGDRVHIFHADDNDRDKETNGKVLYYFDNATSDAADLAFFHLNADTGELTTAKKFGTNTKRRFQISIRAQDLGVPTPFSTILPRIAISVDDGNNEAPRFTKTQYPFSVPEEEAIVSLGTVYAEDLDDYKRTCYDLEVLQGPKELADYFNISTYTDQPAELSLTRPLDRENASQASVSLRVTATDCTPVNSLCDQPNFLPDHADVLVTVTDINDNPPVFDSSEITVGVTSTAKTGHVIVNLQEYVTDRDIGANRRHEFRAVQDLEADKDLRPSLGAIEKPLALSANGSVTTFADLPGDAEGFFTWAIMANDSAGNDTVSLKIYVVSEDKLIRITFSKSLDELRKTQNEIIGELTNRTGLQFIADNREPFEDDKGIVYPGKSVLIVHALNEKRRAMDSNKLRDFLDHAVAVTTYLKTHQGLENIEMYKSAASQADEETRTEYILAAVICALVVAFLITLYLMINNIRRFKRKLKAATIETYAMSSPEEEKFPGLKTPKSNPIFEKDDELNGDKASVHSNDSLDMNNVDAAAVKPSHRNDEADNDGADDEQEVTMDLYGEETETSPPLRMDQLYLQQAIAEHERSKVRGLSASSNSNGVGSVHGPKANGVGQRYTLHGGDDVDLDNCESTEI